MKPEKVSLWNDYHQMFGKTLGTAASVLQTVEKLQRQIQDLGSQTSALNSQLTHRILQTTICKMFCRLAWPTPQYNRPFYPSHSAMISRPSRSRVLLCRGQLKEIIRDAPGVTHLSFLRTNIVTCLTV